MTSLDVAMEEYLEKIKSHLNDVPISKRNNFLEEVKDHLELFIKDYLKKGFGKEEIVRKIHEEFLPPEQLAHQIIVEYNSSTNETGRKYAFLTPLIIILAAPLVIPDYSFIVLALILFTLSYIVLKNKFLWIFAAIRKNPNGIKNRNKIAQIGSIYLFIMGILILLGGLIEISNKETILLILIVGSSLSFFTYIQKLGKQ